MDAYFSKIWYDPATGFVGADKMYDRVKSKGYSKKQVQDWLKKQYVYQVQSQKPNPQYIPFDAPKGVYQADLMFYEKLFRQNNGYRYILNIINIHSRKAWSIPLKKKDARTAIENFV